MGNCAGKVPSATADLSKATHVRTEGGSITVDCETQLAPASGDNAAASSPAPSLARHLSSASAVSAEVWHDALDGDDASTLRSKGEGDAGAAALEAGSLQAQVAVAMAPYMAGDAPVTSAVEDLWGLAAQPGCSVAAVQDALQRLPPCNPRPPPPVLSASTPANLARATALRAAAPPPAKAASELLALTAATLRLLSDEAPPWRLVSSGNLVLHYAHEEGRHAVRGATVAEALLENGLALAREIDLVTQWNGAFASCEALAEFSDAEFLVHQAVWTPWPIVQPEALQSWALLDLLHTPDRCVIITCTDLGDDAEGLAPRDAGPTRRARMHLQSAFYFRPLEPDTCSGAPRTLLKALIVADARLLPLPAPLLQFVLRVFAPLVHRVVNATLHDLFNTGRAAASPMGRQLAEAIAARPLYARMRREVAAGLARTDLGSAANGGAHASGA